MSITCPYLLGSVTAVLEGSFPNFNMTCKENRLHYSLLTDMFCKAEMRGKGNSFDRRVKTLKCGFIGKCIAFQNIVNECYKCFMSFLPIICAN